MTPMITAVMMTQTMQTTHGHGSPPSAIVAEADAAEAEADALDAIYASSPFTK
jgi:hypothetical protein